MSSETTCEQCGEEMVMLCPVCLDAEEPTPPATAMLDGARPVRREVLAGEAAELLILRIRDADHDTELTTLRQRLAEAEADLKQMSHHADAWKEAFDREWKRAEKAQADAARWKGAARVCEALVGACEECIKNSVGYDDDEWAIELPITYGMIRSARAAIATASALVREGGGGA